MSKLNDLPVTGLPVPPALQGTFAGQRRAFAADMNPTLAQRQDRLTRLAQMTEQLAPALPQAISDDFGHRSPHVTRLADLMVVRAAIRHAQRRLPRWMAVRRVPTAPAYWPGTSRVHPQPLGVVGIVGPWNYPFQLAVGPAVSALAAGNRVMVKPSEQTPRLAELLARTAADHFAADELAVVQGDAQVAQAFVSLPFNHLLFTGSTQVGRAVALAAAANLTPVTLELGGKSPAIISADCDLAEAAPRLLMGKLFNTGQTCIAPDYVLLPASLLQPFIAQMRQAAARLYPTIAGNPDYTSIVSDRHQARLDAVVADAVALGARALPLHAETATLQRRMPPVLLLDVDDRMVAMQQEIFGPVLPVVTYTDIADAIAFVNRRDRPLSLYWFGRSRQERDHVLRQTLSGGVTVNDCLWHVAQDGLPFGGVGASGHGCYHGVHGFDTFSHLKAVFHQSPHSGLRFMYPPYRASFELLARWVQKFV